MENIKQKLAEQLTEILNHEIEEHDLEVPKTEYGDVAFPTMQLTAQNDTNTSELLDKVKKQLNLPEIEDIKLEGPGYINFYFNRVNIGKQILSKDISAKDDKDEKVIVEHTSRTLTNLYTWELCVALYLETQ